MEKLQQRKRLWSVSWASTKADGVGWGGCGGGGGGGLNLSATSSRAMVLVLFAVCVALLAVLWLDAGLRSCFVLFVFLFLCLEQILSIMLITSYKKRELVACVLSILVCLLFPLASRKHAYTILAPLNPTFI